MLLRELVRRHLEQGARVAVAADPGLFPDLERVASWSVAQDWEGDPPVAVVVDVGAEGGPAAALAPWVARWPEVDTWLLLHPARAAELPVGPLVSAARAQGLHLVEAVPLPHRYGAAVVASRSPRHVLGYLEGNAVEVPDEDAAARAWWEWGLTGLVHRARDTDAEVQLAELTARCAALQAQLDAARERAAEGDREAQRAVEREARLRASASYVLGQQLVRLRAHPLSAARALLADGRRLRRSRRTS
ncbi:MAG TPA: hypothetical protein VM097_06970 [Mycobacteriales bacterium]|nr:hypothetical protein [Mycobacteriales bacterium]